MRVGFRRWGGLGLAAALVFPSAAQAAGPQVRLLNAAVSGKVTIQLDGKTEFSRVKLGRTTRRHTVRAGRHVVTATIGKGKAKKVIARLRATLKKGQRVTIVYAVKGHRPSLFLFAEPAAARGAIVFRAANFASAAGAVSIRIGSTVVAKNVRFAGVTPARRLFPRSSATGLLKVSARHGSKTMTAKEPLVLATKSVGLFVVIPRGRRAQVVRLPYTTPVPAPTHQPVLTGTRRFGHTVRCTADRWRPGAAVTQRRWTVDGKVVGSGKAHTLTTAVDAGHKVACVVSGTLNGMTTTATVAFNFPAVPVVVTPPSVKAPAGALAAGQSVTCDHGAWKSAPSTYAYRWIRKATGVAFATGRTYTLKLPDDNGPAHALSCEVVATNSGGVSSAATSANTIALGVPPTVTLLTEPVDGTTLTTADFSWAVGGGGADTVECKLDAAAFVACAGPLAQTYTGLATSLNGTAHTFAVRVTNGVASATTSFGWKVNPVAPTIVLNAASEPANGTQATSANFTWTVGGGPRTVSCTLDNVTKTCGVALTGLSTSPAGVSHTFRVTATNVTSQVFDSYTWTINPQLPTVAFGTVPAQSSADTSPAFTWSAGGGGATGFSCQVDTGAVHACGTSETPTGLAADPGGVSHTFKVTATNASGDSAPATYTWTIFSQPVLSNVAVDAVDQTTHADVTLTFTVTGTTTSVTCQIDGGPAVDPCASGHVFTDPGPGTHTVSVSASNVAGTDTQSAPSWTFLP